MSPRHGWPTAGPTCLTLPGRCWPGRWRRNRGSGTSRAGNLPTRCGRRSSCRPTGPPAPAAPAVARHPRTEVSAIPAHPASALAAAGTPGRPGSSAPSPVMPAAAPDRPTEDVEAPGQRPWPGPGPDGIPARPARRRRYLTITLACGLLVVAAAIPLLLARPGTPPTGPHVGTRTATLTPGGKRRDPPPDPGRTLAPSPTPATAPQTS